MNNNFNFSEENPPQGWRRCQSGVLRRYNHQLKKDKVDLQRRKSMIQIVSGAATMVAGVTGFFLLRRFNQTPPQPVTQVMSVPINGPAKAMRTNVRRIITCGTFISSLTAFIEDEIADEPLRKDLKDHLAYCKSCQQKFTQMGGDMSQV